MKCRKAQDLYFRSRDGELGEADGLELARHLSSCPSCALFAKETDASLALVEALPEPVVSENFDWNVKRRIVQEKARLMRRENGLLFGERRWMSRFVVGSAAAAAIVVLAALLAVQRVGAPRPIIAEAVPESRSNVATIQVSSTGDGGFAGYDPAGFSAGPRMVSDNIYTFERSSEVARQSPFEIVADSPEEALARENELLKRRIDNLERQIVWLKGLLDRERMQRLNMSLP